MYNVGLFFVYILMYVFDFCFYVLYLFIHFLVYLLIWLFVYIFIYVCIGLLVFVCVLYLFIVCLLLHLFMHLYTSPARILIIELIKRTSFEELVYHFRSITAGPCHLSLSTRSFIWYLRHLNRSSCDVLLSNLACLNATAISSPPLHHGRFSIPHRCHWPVSHHILALFLHIIKRYLPQY